jgi:hypothetical protein
MASPLGQIRPSPMVKPVDRMSSPMSNGTSRVPATSPATTSATTNTPVDKSPPRENGSHGGKTAVNGSHDGKTAVNGSHGGKTAVNGSISDSDSGTSTPQEANTASRNSDSCEHACTAPPLSRDEVNNARGKRTVHARNLTSEETVGIAANGKSVQLLVDVDDLIGSPASQFRADAYDSSAAGTPCSASTEVDSNGAQGSESW